jgi:hypothetical protein
MKNRKTPIALFSYNRPQHVERALSTLACCARLDECDLHFFSDGLRLEEHRAGWEAARRIVRARAADLNATVVEAAANLGCSPSIVKHVTELCREYGRVIVVEDDFVLNPGYVSYLLDGLDRYENEPAVFQVSAYMFPVELPPGQDAYLMPYTTAWGWATWQRAWQKFDWDAAGIADLLADAEAARHFNLRGGVNYTKSLRAELERPRQIYDVMWYYAVFKHNGLVAHPRRSLVYNADLDGSGTFSTNDPKFPQVPRASIAERVFDQPIRWPEIVALDETAYAALTTQLRIRRERKPPIHVRARHKLAIYRRRLLAWLAGAAG